MKPKALSAIGGWQSLLFCIGMYVVALIFSIFVCSAIFYTVNAKANVSKRTDTDKAVVKPAAKPELASVSK